MRCSSTAQLVKITTITTNWLKDDPGISLRKVSLGITVRSAAETTAAKIFPCGTATE